MPKFELADGTEWETGVIFDGAYGRYNLTRLIALAQRVSKEADNGKGDGGFTLDETDNEATAAYDSGDEDRVIDESTGAMVGDIIPDLAYNAENYLNSLIPPELTLPDGVAGISFAWDDGDFGFWCYDDDGTVVPGDTYDIARRTK